jgi:F-type H+-transporting ATPase subunit b
MKRLEYDPKPSASTIAMVIAVMIGTVFCFNIGVVMGSSGGGEAAAPKGWVATDTYRVMNFSVLALVLFFLLKKPASKALGDRIKSIKEQINDLEKKKGEAEKELEQFNQKLSLLEKEAEEIVEKYKQQGEEARAKIIKEAETAAGKLQDQARKNMDYELKEASKKLQGDILEKALAKAELMIQEQISKEDQDRLIDEYLQKVEAQ